MEEAASKYNINVIRDVYLVGEAHHVALLKKLLKPYYFLHPRDGDGAAGYREEMHFLVVAASLSQPEPMRRLATALEASRSPLVRKMVYVVEPEELSREQLLLLQELGARFVACGIHRNEDLKEQLKRICVEAHQVGPLEAFEADVDRGLRAHDGAALQRVIEKLKEVPSPGEDVLRLLALACQGVGDHRRAEAYLKRLLQANPQNLWAANELGKSYLRSGRAAEGIEVLERLSRFHELNAERLLTLGDAYVEAGYAREAETAYRKGDKLASGEDARFKDGLAKAKIVQQDFAGALSLLAGRGLSRDILSFLNMRAVIATREKRIDEALRYYQAALDGAGEDKLVQAKVKFNMGLAHARGGDLERARQCLYESAVLGGGKFERARKPLEIVRQAITAREKQQAQGEKRDAGGLVVDSEWETLY